MVSEYDISCYIEDIYTNRFSKVVHILETFCEKVTADSTLNYSSDSRAAVCLPLQFTLNSFYMSVTSSHGVKSKIAKNRNQVKGYVFSVFHD